MVIRALAISLGLACALPAQAVRLPSRAPLFVYQGGDTPNVNYHMAMASQAYAVDFAVVGGPKTRDLARRPASRPEDYYCWDTAVLSPVDGRVIETLDSLPDNAIGVRDPVHPLGNHVTIAQGDRYFYLAHLRQRMLTVHAGDTVTAGQAVGRCGNSGNTDFPHIHLHATNSPKLGEGTGINLVFGPMNVVLAGKTFENVEWPMLRGLWVHAP
jgi:peptidase M23-like protein